MQFSLYQRNQLSERILISLAPGNKQLRDIGRKGRFHNAYDCFADCVATLPQPAQLSQSCVLEQAQVAAG
jgi:hypothetical protein